METYLEMHKEAFDKIYDPNDEKAYTLTNNIEHLRVELKGIKKQLLDVEEDSEDENIESFKDEDTLPEEPRLCNAAEEIFNDIDSILRKRLGKILNSFSILYTVYPLWQRPHLDMHMMREYQI